MKTLANTERLDSSVTFATDISPGRSEPSDAFVIREDGRYVFDGNLMVARFRVGRNGVGRWQLETIDPGLALVITPDLRIREYRRTDHACVVHIIRVFGSVFDALKPLDEAVCPCAQHSHAWSPTQNRAADTLYSWQWCLVCGAERVRFPDTREWLSWPEDGDTITERTAGALPTLHGPVLGSAL